MRIENLTKENTNNLLEKLLKRSPTNYDSYEKDVKAIINNVKDNGDRHYLIILYNSIRLI